jgi:hypothetical protein
VYNYSVSWIHKAQGIRIFLLWPKSLCRPLSIASSWYVSYYFLGSRWTEYKLTSHLFLLAYLAQIFSLFYAFNKETIHENIHCWEIPLCLVALRTGIHIWSKNIVLLYLCCVTSNHVTELCLSHLTICNRWEIAHYVVKHPSNYVYSSHRSICK